MPFMPFAILPMWFLGLLSSVMLFGGAWVWYQWGQGVHVAAVLLICAAVALIFSAFGRFIVLALHRGGSDDPTWARSNRSVALKRPDGTILHVEFSGVPDEATVIFVHGWGVDNRAFFYTKRFLSTSHRLIAWDLRGLGRSGKAARGDYSLDAMADDLAAVVELAGGRVVLCGHSIGGMIIQTFARRHAEAYRDRVVAAVLANTTYTDPVATMTAHPLMRALERPLFVPLMYLTIALAPVVWLMNWLSYINGTLLMSAAVSGFSGKESRGQLDFATRFSAKADPAVVARGTLAMFRFDETSSIGNIPGPVLIVTGTGDPVTLPSASEHLQRVIKGSRLVKVESAKHMSCIEYHDAFDTEFEAFMGTHTAAPVRSEQLLQPDPLGPALIPID